MSFVHLHTMQQSLIVVLEPTPTLVYWGKQLKSVCHKWLDQCVLGVPQAGLDSLTQLSFIPQIGRGSLDVSGLDGHRQGHEWASVFTTTSWEQDGNQVLITCENNQRSLALIFSLHLSESHVFSMQVTLKNIGDIAYSLGRLAPTLPLPMHIDEYMNFCGDWAREFQVERGSLGRTFALQENRTGRTSHHAPPFFLLGSQGFNELHGDVFAFHLAWSGNHGFQAGLCANGQPFVQAYELLMSGEITLEAGQSYSTPCLYGAYSYQGLSLVRQQFHRFVRQNFLSETHTLKSRPVHVNTWEAVYFNHDLPHLLKLAESAAGLGIERFVLDDGWFKGRHDETSSLGDWTPDPEKYPHGLTPLINKVHDLGLEFGLWVEPEMVNPDSDLYRTHPDWVLQVSGSPCHLARHQLVLDLQNPDVFDYVRNALQTLLDTYPIDYLKWDMNRPLTQAGHANYPAMHGQVHQVYRLLQAIKSRYPELEIESCASGGGRMDYAILKNCQRFWVSDNNDPIERQKMYPIVSCFFPPEVLGAHVGPKANPITGRRVSLNFSLLTTLFYHMGFECDVSLLSETDAATARKYITLYKQMRDYFHTGDLWFPPVPDPSVGVCAVQAQGQCVVLVTQLCMSRFGSGFSLRIPCLEQSTTYRVCCLDFVDASEYPSMKAFPDYLQQEQAWVGQWLQEIGLPIPAMPVKSALLLHFLPVDEKG